MKILQIFLLLLIIILNAMTLITAQWCISFKSVLKTRIQWNNGERVVSKRNFFGMIKYKYEPYLYSTVQTYHDYERINACCDGYVKVNDTKCDPVCDPACPANTHCIRPNICECNVGYSGYTASATNIQCGSCYEGYEDTDGSGTCQPTCVDMCPENSSCTEPNQCTCNAGYLDNGWDKCQPICSPTCPDNSDCTQPDTCTCQENYTMQEDKCVAICDPQCPQYAGCANAHECKCNEGYDTIEYHNVTSFTCTAKCVAGCPANAHCIQPNVCECQQGYKENDMQLCEPTCESGCPAHSKCSEPNTCSCDKGYIMIAGICEPFCEKACPEHGLCSEPNKCMCPSGYQMKLSSIYNLYCEPVCQSNCSAFGKCVQPNKCECLEGYEMNEVEVCQPVCKRGCRNGLCFQPEICICNPGFLMGPQEECEPSCSMPCENGSCIEPEICQCHDGYQLQNNSINVCEPVCKSTCVNGICAAPNVCICQENYEPIATGNHSNCQFMPTTTIAPKYQRTNQKEVSANEQSFKATTKTLALTTDLLATVNKLVSADICNANCQCWQEFDEFGALGSNQCTRLCADERDQSCLNLKLCQCDLAKNQLVCRTTEEELLSDDPIFYKCSLSHFKATTLKPNDEGISSDRKSVRTIADSKFAWWWLLVVAGFICVCIITALLYIYFRKREEPIMEYEL